MSTLSWAEQKMGSKLGCLQKEVEIESENGLKVV